MSEEIDQKEDADNVQTPLAQNVQKVVDLVGEIMKKNGIESIKRENTNNPRNMEDSKMVKVNNHVEDVKMESLDKQEKSEDVKSENDHTEALIESAKVFEKANSKCLSRKHCQYRIELKELGDVQVLMQGIVDNFK